MTKAMRTKLLSITRVGALALLAAPLSSCVQDETPRNAFLTYIESFALESIDTSATDGSTLDSGSGQGSLSAPVFRQPMTLTFTNNNADASLEANFLAWVDLSSVESGEQQDALIENGYVQVSRTIQIGTVFELPVGTFVFNGDRGSSPSELNLAPAGGQGSSVAALQFITPDVILLFSEPPVSCDSVAFVFADDDLINIGPSASRGGRKTLAQVGPYQCDPLRPGLFYRAQGGQLQANEYREGDAVTFSFFANPSPAGAFATVTIGN